MTEIILASYGCKHGPYDTDTPVTVVTCHDIPNPHSINHLRHLDGTDDELQTWVLEQTLFTGDCLARARKEIAKALHPTFKSDTFTVAFECIGGRHRSVAVAEILKKELTGRGINVTVNHQNLNRN